MLNHGLLFRKLRQERGFSQSEIARNVSARETLTRFEKGTHAVSLRLFIGYLDNLGLELYDYNYLYHQNISTEQQLSLKFKAIKYSKTDLLAYQEEVLTLYNQLSNLKFYHLYCQAKLFYKHYHSSDFINCKTEQDYIMTLLSTITTWSLFEIDLFISLMPIFPTHFLKKIMHSCLKSIQTLYIHTPYDKRLLAKLYLNFSIAMIQRHDFETAHKHLTDSHNYSYKHNLLYELILTTIFQIYLTNNHTSLSPTIILHLDYLSNLGYSELSKQIKSFLESLSNSYSPSVHLTFI